MKQNRISVLGKVWSKTIGWMTAVLLSGWLFVSCDDVNSVHQEYYDRGEMIYTGVVDSLKASVGFEKVKFSWEINADPRITKTVIYWNQKSDSVVVDVNRTGDGRMPMSYESHFPEDNYIFEFVTKDDEGHYSMTKELVVVVLGKAYASDLKTRKVASVKLGEEGDVSISWSDVASTLLMYTNVEYEVDGKKEVIQVGNDENKTVLGGLKAGDKFYVSSVYQPDGAFETFVSPLTEYVVE